MDTKFRDVTFSIPSGTMIGDDVLDLLGCSVVKDGTSKPKERLVLSSMADIWANHEPIEFLIDGLIPRASVCQFVGDAGSKKTWALIDMAICVAKGDDWLGLTVKQSPVIWVDEENGSTRMRRRFYLAARGHLVKAEDELPLHFSCMNGMNLRNEEDVAILQARVQELGAGLIVLDPQVALTGGAKENSAEEMQPFFSNLKRIADSTRSAIVVIHHSNKNGDYRGSTAIKGAVDTMIGVESKSDSKFISFTNKKLRDAQTGEFVAVAHFVGTEDGNPDEAQFYLSRFEGEAGGDVAKLGKPMRYVLRYLLEHGNSPVKEIESNADICAPASARTALYTLSDKGYTKRTNTGEQLSAQYELTETGKQLAGRL